MSKSYVRQGAAVLPAALLMTTALAGTAFAACTGSADSLTLNCGGTLAIGAGLLITVYGAAAARRPPTNLEFTRGEE